MYTYYIIFLIQVLLPALSVAGVTVENLPYSEARKSIQASEVVVLTVASDLKVHGPHLPLKTDSILAQALMRDFAAETGAAVLPNLTLGWYPQFSQHSLTKYSPATIQALVREHLEGIIEAGAKRIFVINFDVDKTAGLPISTALYELRQKHKTKLLLFSWYDFVDKGVTKLLSSSPGHADELETSLMLYLAPELVKTSLIKDTKDLDDQHWHPQGFYPVVFEKNFPGHFGKPKEASAEKGKLLYSAIKNNLVKAIKEFSGK